MKETWRIGWREYKKESKLGKKKKKKDLREIESNFRTRSSFSCPGVSFPFSQQQSVGGERR